MGAVWGDYDNDGSRPCSSTNGAIAGSFITSGMDFEEGDGAAGHRNLGMNPMGAVWFDFDREDCSIYTSPVTSART